MRRFGPISGKSTAAVIRIQFISFYLFKGGIGGDGGAGGVPDENQSDVKKSLDNDKSYSIPNADNAERSVSGIERFIISLGTSRIEVILTLPQVAKEVAVDGVFGWVVKVVSAVHRLYLWRLSANSHGLKVS